MESDEVENESSAGIMENSANSENNNEKTAVSTSGTEVTMEVENRPEGLQPQPQETTQKDTTVEFDSTSSSSTATSTSSASSAPSTAAKVPKIEFDFCFLKNRCKVTLDNAICFIPLWQAKALRKIPENGTLQLPRKISA